jgi:dTDP-4-dehydrorhamnose reductase
MKILIVGEDGQLGTDCQAVLPSSHTLLTPHHSVLDLRSEECVKSFIRTHRPETIINCAAFTAVDACETKQEIAWQVNSDGPRYLAQAADETGARLIHTSTDYVFDGNKPAPQAYTETDKVNPLSQYGSSKLSGEQAVQKYCENHLILRTAWLYSANGPNFLKTMLHLTMADPDRQLKVVNDQYGSLTWSYTLAQQINMLLDDTLHGIAHTTADGYSTWYEAACYFLEKMEVPFNIIPCSTKEYPTPAHRPKNSILANTKLDDAGLSVFKDWRADVDLFVQTHGEKLKALASKEITAQN